MLYTSTLSLGASEISIWLLSCATIACCWSHLVALDGLNVYCFEGRPLLLERQEWEGSMSSHLYLVHSTFPLHQPFSLNRPLYCSTITKSYLLNTQKIILRTIKLHNQLLQFNYVVPSVCRCDMVNLICMIRSIFNIYNKLKNWRKIGICRNSEF